MFVSIVRQISDWLIAIFVASLIIALIIIQPVFVNTGLETANLPLGPDKDSRLQHKLRVHVKELTETYSPRSMGYDNLIAASLYIKQYLQRGEGVRTHATNSLQGEFITVSQLYEPALGKLQDKNLLIFAACYESPDDSLDAEGNASGVAVLLELSRLLASHHDQLTSRVLLIAYPLSGQQGTGRNRLRNKPKSFLRDYLEKEQGITEVNVVVLDGVGRFSSKDRSQSYPAGFMTYFYPDQGDFIQLSAQLGDYQFLRKTKRSLLKGSQLPVRSFLLPDYYLRYVDSGFDKASAILSRWNPGMSMVRISDTGDSRSMLHQQGTVAEQLDYRKMAALSDGLLHLALSGNSSRKYVKMAAANRDR